MTKRYFTDESLATFVDETKAYTDSAVSTKADSSHDHAASNITSGTLSSDRLPTVPITKGGTGSTTAAGALTNLGITATAAELNKMDGVTATTAELNYVDGVTSNIQTQLNNKLATSTASSTYMTQSNPTGTGSFSLNRKSGTTTGEYSHAEGLNATASAAYSHAEGYGATASGTGSHAEGYNTIVSKQYQHVQGKYNVEDTSGDYAHIVGNGTGTSARSNAHTLDWDGNAWFAGNVYVGGTSQDNATSLASVATMTAAEYEALETYDEATLYNISDAEEPEVMDLTSAQIVTGVKTFTNGIEIGDEGVQLTYDAPEGAFKITFLSEIVEDETETTTE